MNCITKEAGVKMKHVATVVVCALLGVGCAALEQPPAPNDSVSRVLNEMKARPVAAKTDDRDARIAALERDLQQRDARIAELEREKQRLSDELAAERSRKAAMGDMSARVRDLEQQLAACQDELTRLKTQLAERDQEISRLKAQLAAAAASATAAVVTPSLAKTEEDLLALLKPEIDKGNITVTRAGDTLTINLASALLFDPGKGQLKPAGADVMKRVGNVLSTVSDKKVDVSGHTDNVPITGKLKEKYPTNMELSKARADNALKALGMSGTATGYADTKPVASNATPEGRAKNRRVEVVVSPK